MISICIITKNEEKNLEECLKNLVKLNYEIVVVDTGSVDNSRDIARKYTSKVYEFEWCDDFSAARNFSISKASEDIVFIIDSDEFIAAFDKEAVEKIFKQNQRIVGRIQRKEKFGINGEFSSNDFISRVFSKKYYHYAGRVHEQIVSSIDGGAAIKPVKQWDSIENYIIGEEIINLPVIVLHNGYEGEELRKRKAKRNIQLLEEELVAGEDPYILYQLGKSYYMIAEYEKACAYFSRGLTFDVNPQLEYVIDMVETYGYSLINTRQYETALQFENIYEQFGNTADFQFLMGLIYMNNAKFEKAVEEFQKAATWKYCRVEGVNSYSAWYNIGVILECLGKNEDAIKFYEKCGNYEKAVERLELLR